VKGNGALRHWNLGGIKLKKYTYRFEIPTASRCPAGSTSLRFAQNDENKLIVLKCTFSTYIDFDNFNNTPTSLFI